MTLSDRFVEAARQIREQFDLRSDRAVSLALGLNENYIQRVKAGVQRPQTEAIESMLLKFRVNVRYLYTGFGDVFEADRTPMQPIGAAAGAYNAEMALKQLAAEPGIRVVEPPDRVRIERLERQLAALTLGLAELLTQLKQV